MTDILIVDDDPSIVCLIEYNLQGQGYTVRTATNGREGLRQVELRPPDLVILDVMMPVMDGWKACQRIRQISDVPILMLTAKDQEDDIVQGLDIGADEYVVKPFRIKTLIARIEAILRRVTQERQAVQKQVESLKSSIMSTVSHELRTPVAVILNTLDLLLRDAFHDDVERQQYFVASARQNAESLRWLIDDVLMFAQLDREPDVLRRPVSVPVELDRLRGKTQPAQQARNLTVSWYCPEDLSLNADLNKFRHALHHLYSNALKFSPEGGKVTVEAEGNSDGSVMIAFSDQGPGIEIALHERIFEQFYQIDSSDTRAYGGLGIGLAIVRAIARAHQGNVTVESTPGQGSTFRLTLPAASADWEI